jgi:hypothetical protein
MNLDRFKSSSISKEPKWETDIPKEKFAGKEEQEYKDSFHEFLLKQGKTAIEMNSDKLGTMPIDKLEEIKRKLKL